MKISFVIIEYNSIQDVSTCVSEIKNLTLQYFIEVIISSNSCYSLRYQKELRELHKDVIWSFNSKNGGFGYGMNRGVDLASGDLVVIRNPDTKILKEDFDSVFDYIINQNYGALGPLIQDSSGIQQETIRRYPTLFKVFKRLFSRYLGDPKKAVDIAFDNLDKKDNDAVIGGFMFINPKAWKDVAGFDEGYFLYLEDIDLCFRMKESGYKIGYVPSFQVVYKGDCKSSRLSLKNRYLGIHIYSLARFLVIFYKVKIKNMYRLLWRGRRAF